MSGSPGGLPAYGGAEGDQGFALPVDHVTHGGQKPGHKCQKVRSICTASKLSSARSRMVNPGIKMKAKAKTPSRLRREPTEREVRDYAYYLYQKSGCVPGSDFQNWRTSRMSLKAKRRSSAVVATGNATPAAAGATAVRFADELESDSGFQVERFLVTK